MAFIFTPVRKIHPFLLFLLFCHLAVGVWMYTTRNEPKTGGNGTLGWTLQGEYVPTDEELGIMDASFYAPRDSSEAW